MSLRTLRQLCPHPESRPRVVGGIWIRLRPASSRQSGSSSPTRKNDHGHDFIEEWVSTQDMAGPRPTSESGIGYSRPSQYKSLQVHGESRNPFVSTMSIAFHSLGSDVMGIVLEHADVPTLRSLRLVSKTMNLLAEPAAFKIATIHISRHQSRTEADLQSRLFAQDSPTNRWTKELTINSLTPVELSYATGRPPDIVACCVIQRMRRVETVRYYVKSWESYSLILNTLAKLPKLRGLFLMFITHIPHVLPLGEFSHLTSIELHSVVLSAGTIEALSAMIQRCPDLKKLGITTWKWSTPFNSPLLPAAGMELATLFPPAYQSKLTHLTSAKDSFTLSSSSVRFLGALSHLHIRNTKNVHPSFWQALQTESIRLKSLAVYPLSPPVVTYLTSYSGLSDLSLIHAKFSNGIIGDLAHELFFHVLPCHKATLQHLSFGPYLPFEIWSITEEYLDRILQCRCLKTLHLLFRYPSALPVVVDPSPMVGGTIDDPFISLHTLLSRITGNLPDLRRLTLKPTPGRRSPFASDYARQASYRLFMKRDFPSAICDVTFDAAKPPLSSSPYGTSSHVPRTAPAGAQNPAFRLIVAHHPFHYTLFDRKTRRFKWAREISEEELRQVKADSDGSDD